jgi:hypothetical protein
LAFLAMLPNTFALGDFCVLFAILGLKRGEYVAPSLVQCKGILDPSVLFFPSSAVWVAFCLGLGGPNP